MAELGAQSVVYQLATVAFMVCFFIFRKMYTYTGFRVFSDPAASVVFWSMCQDISITFI